MSFTPRSRWQDSKPLPAPHPIDAEASLVGGENKIRACVFGQDNKCRIGKVHGEIGVFPHQMQGTSQDR